MKKLLLIIILFINTACDGPKSKALGFDEQVHEKFTELKIGESLDLVKQKLGEPIRKAKELNLPQKKGFENFFKDSRESNSKIYLLWMNGGNWYYSIGFDEKNKVAFKAEGHS